MKPAPIAVAAILILAAFAVVVVVMDAGDTGDGDHSPPAADASQETRGDALLDEPSIPETRGPETRGPETRREVESDPPPAEGAPAPEAPLAPGWIRGAVIDADSKQPVGAARIVVRRDDGSTTRAATDDDGTFVVRDLIAGEDCELVVEARGWTLRGDPPRVVAEALERDDGGAGDGDGARDVTTGLVTIFLHRAFVLLGRVLDQDGRGIAALIEVRRGARRFTVVSGADGAFAVDDVASRLGYGARPPERFAQLWARSDRHVDVYREIARREIESGAPIEIRMGRGAEIAGRCLGPGDQPIPGVEVACYPLTGSRFAGLRTALTDDRGGFRFAGLETGLHRVEPAREAQGMAPDRRSIDVDVVIGGAAGSADFFYGSSGDGLPIAGRVVDARTEEPLVSRTVRLRHSDWLEPMEAETAEDGGFRFAPLPPGTYQVAVRGESWLDPGAVWIEEATAGSVDLLLAIDVPSRDGSLRLLPYDGASGRPLEKETEITLHLVAADDGNLSRHVEARDVYALDAGGAIVVDGLEYRDYEGEVSAPGHAGQRFQFAIDFDHRSIELRLPLETGVTVRGRVLDDDGLPVERARVCASGEDGLQTAMRTDDGVETDADGRFAVEHVTTRAAWIGAIAPGLAPSRIDLPAGARDAASINDLVIRLERGSHVSGIARYESGAPARRFVLALRGAVAWHVTSTDDAGRFDFDAVEPGPFTIEDADGAVLLEDEVPGEMVETQDYELIVPD